MYSNLIKKILFSIFTVLLVACSSLQKKEPLNATNIAPKEKLYISTQNYKGLISLYREVLKNGENPNIRYKLSDSYYRNGDNKSALLYLEPLLVDPKFVEKATVLEIKSLIQLRKYNDAISTASQLITRYPNNVDAYNVRGIAYAQIGKLDNALHDFTKARSLFIDDLVAINNLAMLYIINGDYKNASELLLPQYVNGEKDQRLIHNLVFALVKSGDTKYALDIIRKERLSTSPESLIDALRKTEKNSKKVAVIK